jgi:uncharacterized protein YciI
MYHLLFYDVVDDYVRRRQPFRPEHLAHAERAHRDGALVMAGALSPADGAVFVFRASAADVEAFARADPYVQNGLVKAWRVREWSVVVGGDTPPAAR